MSKHSVELLARGVLVRNRRLLICRTGDAPIVYLPGGHVEFGETVRSALAREIAEELGYPAKVGRFLGGMQHTFMQTGRRHWEINLVFAMTLRGLPRSATPVSRERHLRFEWIRMDQLAIRRLEPAMLCERLPAWLRGGDVSRWDEPGVDG